MARKMQAVNLAVCWGCILVFLPRADSAASGAEGLKGRFLREAPLGWKKLREAERHVAGTIHIESWATFGDGTRRQGRETDIQFQRSGNLLKLVNSSPKKESSSVLGIGPRYLFYLRRASKSKPYVIQALSFGRPEDRIKDKDFLSSTYFFRATQASREFWNVPLEDIITEPSFTLKGVSERNDGKPIVRVEFDCRLPKYKSAFNRAWMDLCPSEDWSLQAAEYYPRDDWMVSITNEYRPNRSGRLSLFRYTKQERFFKDKVDEVYQFTTEDLEDRVVPESEFTVAAFGLPELGRSSRSYYWGPQVYLILGSASLFGLAVLSRWAARRLSRSES